MSSNVHEAPSVPLPFGPYIGRDVSWVAVVDPPYLRDLLAEGIGSAELRAAAARSLARRGALPVAEEPQVWSGGETPVRRAARSAPTPLASRAAPLLAWLRAHPAAALLLLVGALLVAWRVGATRDATAIVAGPRATAGVARVGRDVDDAGAASSSPRSTLDRSGKRAGAGLAGAAGPAAGARSPGSATAAARPGSPASSKATGGPSAAPAPCGARIPGAIPAESAADFLDTHQAVEFRVVGTKDTGRVTFLNSQQPYQGHFYVAIFPSDYGLFPAPPAEHFRGRCIVVQGRIERYRGTPQIVLRGPQDVRVVDDGTGTQPYTGTAEPTRGIP